MLTYLISGVLALVVATTVYVRLAPSDVAVWHTPDVPQAGVGVYPSSQSHRVERTVAGDGMAVASRLDAIIRATPRTRVLAGSVESGKITYVTRSRIMGFPDYTTVALTNGTDTTTLQVYGRLRFGPEADMGVNRARVEGWLAELDATTDMRAPTE